MNDSGVIMVATGERHRRQAQVAAQSIIDNNKNIEIALFSDDKPKACQFDKFFKIENTESRKKHRIARIESLINTPFRKTLYLDSDTFVCSDISELFNIIEDFDIGGVFHSTSGPPSEQCPYYNTEVSDELPWLNAGVILYRKTQRTINLLKDWLDVYKEHANDNYAQDQIFIRDLIFKKDIMICPLDKKYNCIYKRMGALEDSVKILHGAGAYRVKEKDLKELADVMEKAHEKSYGGNIMYTGQKSGISGHIYWPQNSVFRSLRKQRYPFNYKMRKFFDDINEIFENKGTKKVLSYILKRFGTYLSD